MADEVERARTEVAKNAYPDKLREVELGLWRKRPVDRLLHNKDRPDLGKRKKGPTVGFGLSGGGIRSATFCLGVFQALAKANLLQEIDYISSVSGGGFFAAFYGRLFTRDDIKSFNEICNILSPDEKKRLDLPDERSWMTGIFRWLRDNGRYLTPNGSGDLLIGIAVFLRNWLTVQLLLAVTLMAIFLAAQILRSEMPIMPGAPRYSNPFLWLSSALALLGLVPLGWAYWTFSIPDPGALPSGAVLARALRRFRRQFTWHGLRTLLALAVLLWIFLLLAETTHFNFRPSLAATILVLTAFFWQLSLFRAAKKRLGVWALFSINVAAVAALAIGYFLLVDYLWALVIAAVTSQIVVMSLWPRVSLKRLDPSYLVNYSEKARTFLTEWLRTMFVTTIAVLTFALVDAAGQWVSTSWSNSTLVVALSALYGVIAAIVPFAQSASAWLRPKETAARVRLSLSAATAIGAVIIILPVLIAFDGLSHKIAEASSQPNFGGQTIAPNQPEVVGFNPHAPAVGVADRTSQLAVSVQARAASVVHSVATATGPARVAAFLLLTVVFLILTGSLNSWTSWVFLNRTSLHALYCARLIRAYLGASNRARYGDADSAGVSDPVDGDDIAQEDYWRPNNEAFWEKGPPFHLVNVTINETIDGRNQTEQRDRKGLGMAIGPAGFSVGVSHHVVITKETPRTANGGFDADVYPKGEGFRVFGDRRGPNHFSGEALSLGNWTAISGAAVSTGLGRMGSIGASLLTGFFNLRLGYWWDSGTRSIAAGQRPLAPETTVWNRLSDHVRTLLTVRFSRNVGKWLAWLFPVQSSLLDEFMGRFHGTLRRRWNLTDGGHFENLAGYELIRRRLPLIVIIDAGGDPRYEFADLANLIRKARLDFNAEIQFLAPNGGDFKKGLNRVHNFSRNEGKAAEVFGTLDQLRRGEWAQEPPVGEGAFFKSTDTQRLSRRHAALAKVTYLDDNVTDENYDPASYLLLIKPTLMGKEPQDLLNYHSAHPDFPHQSTLDQFFDEGQWESYRRLGLHIAERVFSLSAD